MSSTGHFLEKTDAKVDGGPTGQEQAIFSQEDERTIEERIKELEDGPAEVCFKVSCPNHGLEIHCNTLCYLFSETCGVCGPKN